MKKGISAIKFIKDKHAFFIYKKKDLPEIKHAKKQEKITNCKLRKQEMKRKTCFFFQSQIF